MTLDRCIVGDCREVMRDLIASGVKAQTCVSSPPYWGLRDYGAPGQLGLERTPERYVARIQGETDSFGCEMNDCCQECVDEIRSYARSAEARSGRCDWCKNEATDLRDRRDYDEGMSGPVYRACGACVKRQNERLAEEAAEFEDDNYDYEWDDE